MRPISPAAGRTRSRRRNLLAAGAAFVGAALAGAVLPTLAGAPPASPAPVERIAPLPPLGPSAYAERRKRLGERLAARLEPGGRGILLLLGVPLEESLEAPRPNPPFYHLSGVDLPGAALILAFGAGDASETLFLHDPTPRQRTFDRPALVPGRYDWQARADDTERRAAMEATGFKEIETFDRLAAKLQQALEGGAALAVAPAPVSAEAPLSAELDLIARLRERHPAAAILDASADLAALRLIKEPAELARVEAAVGATLAGFRRAAPRIRPGSAEAEVQAEMEMGFRLAGAQRLAFETIVASGPRSTILHYMRNEGKLEEGALVVIDAGAERDGYAADVTRTFPVSGRFDPDQRRMYDAVVEAQEAGMKKARRGATLAEVDKAVRAVLEKAGYGEGIQHGCCHYVGLEVHDVGSRELPLEEGMVFTIEPGVYFPQRQTGIRLEDTFALTSDGLRPLSGSLPRRAADVEAFLASARAGERR
jgi:Xaa-Pro aminopeptidase